MKDISKITANLRDSYLKFGAFYPVLKDKYGNIIDGFHRKKIDANWVEVKLENIDTPLKREILALITNINRREISGIEISKRLEKILNLDKERYFNGNTWNLKLLSEDIAHSYEWVLKYTPQKFKSETIPKPKEVVCHTTSNDTSDTTDTPKQTSTLPIPLITNVWDARIQQIEDYENVIFHGHTPSFILKEIISKYTVEDDVVLDAMCGSGITIDVCRRMNRKYFAFDIKPLRKDIRFGDAEKLPLEDNSVDFVFLHFPYWNKVIYSEDKNDLSNLKLFKFLGKTKRVFREIHRVLKNNKFFVVLIGDVRNKKKIIDLSAYFSLYGLEDFVLFDKIILYASNQRSQKRISKNLSEFRAKKYGYYLQTFDTLLIFKKVNG